MTQQINAPHKKQIGQSLVEVALFLPILVILVAGIVEVSQLLITQNRVSNAARVAARFGSNGGEDDGMLVVALNSVTQTLKLSPEDWDMWVIHGTINDTGDGFNNDWEFTHVYGISTTALFSTVVEADIQQDVIAELSLNDQGTATDAAGLRIVGAYILHDVDSILGLDAFPALAEVSSSRALNVMRVTGVDQNPTQGCSAFPIAVSDKVRSVTEALYPDPTKDFQYPSSPPEYGDFPNHRPDIPLSEAREGDLFFVRNGTQPGNFGWLLWNKVYQTGSEGDLGDSLTWPGNSTQYPEYGFYEAGDETDTTLNIGDYVWATTGTVTSSGVRIALEEHVDRERTLRLIVWDESPASGSNTTYRVSGFAIFRIIGYNLPQKWMLAEFIRMDNSCGQVIP